MTEATPPFVVTSLPELLDGERVDRSVATLCGVSRRDAAAAIDNGGVRLDGKVVVTRSTRVAAGQRLEVELVSAEDRLPQAEPDVEIDVVHADEWLAVIDKRAGQVVHPGAGNQHGTLVGGLLARFPGIAAVGDPMRPGIVHRLDAGTSGLLVVALEADTYTSLVTQLRDRAVERRYLALVWGHVDVDAGVVDGPIGRSADDPTRMAVTTSGRPARTAYQVLLRSDEPRPTTLLECRLETGRTHQIRVHLSAIGHPIVGDERYRGHRPGLGTDRPFLHAHRLAFEHPGTGQRREWDSPLPADLKAVRERLG